MLEFFMKWRQLVEIDVIKIIRKNKWLILLLVIWLGGLWVRVYRQGDLLGFYYDQGRDALQVTKILAAKNFPAIGPTTGLSGIFLGPFWFYLLAPLYFIGHGDPAVAAALVGAVDSLTIFLLYGLGKKFVNEKVGLIAAFLWAFSYWIIRSARWFSNPSLLPFFTVLLFWSLSEWLLRQKEKWFLAIALWLAVSLQLEAASAVFYFPAILLLALTFRRRIKFGSKNKYLWGGIAILLFSLLPQAAFEIKNRFLMTRNFLGFLTGKVNTESGRSWAWPTFSIIKERLIWYHHVFFAQFDPNLRWSFWLVFLFWFFFLAVILRRRNEFVRLVFLFVLTPLFFLFFFVGNYGHLYDYYLTGFLPGFVFLLAYVLIQLPLTILLILLLYFSWQNGLLTRNYLIAGVDGPTHITLGNQKQVINWVCQDAGRQNFNVDVYVPPVIPYAWDYLWQWYGCQKLHCCPAKKNVTRLYTIWEVDPPHPERLKAWLERQAGIGKIEKQARFGGIGSERRKRYEQKNLSVGNHSLL